MTMRRLLSLLAPLASCLAPSAVHAATYAPAAAAAIDWTPNTTGGVGVPGGIPNRTTVYATITTTGDTTDRSYEIKATLAACPSDQVVLLGAGTFYVSTSVYLANNTTYNNGNPDDGIEYGGIGGKTLRGSGSNPATGTVIKFTGSAQFNTNGGQFSGGPGGTVTSSPTKGATTITTADVGEAVVGRLMALSPINDNTLPIMSTRGYNNLKVQVVLITAINTGTDVITFQPPLYQTPQTRVGTPAALTFSWNSSYGRNIISGFGVEDICFDNTDGSGATNFGLNGAHGCWMKNVKAKGVNRYGLSLDMAAQCEIRQCWIDQNVRGDWTGSSHAGLAISTVSACLIEDNVILPNFPVIESQNGNISGNVIAYNFGLAGTNGVTFSSHSTGDHCNLWEGNSTTNITQDGYFGGTLDNIIYRNDLHGVVLGSGTPHWPIELNRFARYWEVVGNQLGRSGTTLAYNLGRPNAFNGNSNGTANILQGDPQIDLSLTGTLTRIADNTYSILMDTTVGQTVVDQWPVSITNWPIGTTRRNWQAITATSSGTLTIALGDNGQNNSNGDVYTTGTYVRLWGGENEAYQEWDNAVGPNTAFGSWDGLGSTNVLGNYLFKDSAIDVALGSTTLPDSLFRSSAPSYFSGYTWPPYSPSSPVTSYGQIPAGARYLESVNTVADPAFSPVAGAYAGEQTVTITSATSGSTIYYTTNGTTPTTSSSVYSTPLTIAVSPSTTLKAFATKATMTDSSVAIGVYSFNGTGVTRVNAGAVTATRINTP